MNDTRCTCVIVKAPTYDVYVQTPCGIHLAMVEKLKDEKIELLARAEGAEATAEHWHEANRSALLQNERLQNKVAQLERFAECFVAHPYEGTLECDVTKPCPFCRYTHMNRLNSEAFSALRVLAEIHGSAAECFYDHNNYCTVHLSQKPCIMTEVRKTIGKYTEKREGRS